MRKAFGKLLEKRWFGNAFALCIAIAFAMVLLNLPNIGGAIGKFFSLISPITLGVVMAYLLSPIHHFFEENFLSDIKSQALKGAIALVLTFLGVIIVIALLLGLVIPSVISAIQNIYANISKYEANINQYLDMLYRFFPDLDLNQIIKLINEGLENIIDIVKNNISTIVNVSIGFGKGIFKFVVGFFICVYILAGKPGIKRGAEKLFSSFLTDEAYASFVKFFGRCHNILTKYIGYNILDSLIVGIINAVLMMVFKLPYVSLVSVIVAVTNLAPTFGPIVGAVFGAIFLVINNPVQAVIFLIIVVVEQIFDGYILKPKLFGGALGVPALGILITIIIGGGMFGVIGILLAIPFAAILTIIYEEIIIPWLKSIKESYIKSKSE